MTEVLPFPLPRRRAFVRRHAEIALGLNPDAGERHIQRQVREQTGNLLRKGVAEELAEAQGKALDAALRAELWRCVMTGGAA